MKTLEFKLAKGSSVALDLIRGASAQLVVVGHGLAFFGVARFLHEPNFPWMQNLAVLVFFLLSGFLIPYSVNRRLRSGDEYSFGHFFVDRFARIYVPFLSALVFVLALDWVSQLIDSSTYKYSAAYNIKTFVGNVLMLQDFPFGDLPFEGRTNNFRVTSFGSARPFWTLAVEWWIYLFVGFVALVLLTTRRNRPLAVVVAGVLGIVPMYNLVLGRGDGLTAYWLMGTIVFLLVALDAARSISRPHQFGLMVTAFGLGILRAYLERDAYDAIVAFLLAISMWFTIEVCRDVTFGSTGSRLITFNASYAYTLYLVHYSVLDFVQVHLSRLGDPGPWVELAVAFVLSNVVAFIIGFVSEGAMTRWVKAMLYRLLARRRDQSQLPVHSV